MKKRVLFTIMLIALGWSMLLMAGCGGHSGKDVYYCPMHPSYTSDKPGDCPICNMRLVKRKNAVHSPQSMVHGLQSPTGAMPAPAQEKTAAEVCIEHGCTMKNCPLMVRVNLKPGEKIACPICGEYVTTAGGKLVPVSTPAKETGPTVMISPEKQQLIGVATAPILKRHLAKTVRASGKIAYDPELFVTQEEFVQALKNEDTLKSSSLPDAADRARSLTEASRRKLRLLGMGGEQIAQLEKSRVPDRSLYLPKKGQPVWAYLSIYEYEIGLVKEGARVSLSAVAYPGEKFEGKVASINPVLDPATRTNQARVEIGNPDDKLKPEMYVNAEIAVDLGERLAIPVSAVMDTGLRRIAYLSREGGVLEAREIRVGQSTGDYYEVLSGLAEGDVIVTSGNFLVDSESRLKSDLGGGHTHGQQQ